MGEDEYEEQTYKELLAMLVRLQVKAGYFCVDGPHRGMMRVNFGAPYMTPDELATIQREAWRQGVR